MYVATYERYIITVTVYLTDFGYEFDSAGRVEDVTSDSRKPKSVCRGGSVSRAREDVVRYCKVMGQFEEKAAQWGRYRH